jgi:hypothetical protein
MDVTSNECNLADTLLVLAGASALNAARRFARECHEGKSHAEATLWERVGAIIEAWTQPQGPKTETDGGAPPSKRRFQHPYYEFALGGRAADATRGSKHVE